MKKITQNLLYGLLAVAVTTSSVHAVDLTWDAGVTTGNWTTPANWSPSGPAAANDRLIFTANADTNYVLENTLAPGTQIGLALANAITFGGAATAANSTVTLTGNGITLLNNGAVAAGSQSIVASNPASGTTQNFINLDIDRGGGTSTQAINVSSLSPLTINGTISGAASGYLYKTGSGTLYLNGSNTFSSDVWSAGNGRLSVPTIADRGVASPLGYGNGTTDIILGSNVAQPFGVVSNGTLVLENSTAASSTNRTIRIGTNTAATTGGFILNNNADPAHTLTFTAANLITQNTSGSPASRPLVLGGSNTGDNTVAGVIRDAQAGVTALNFEKAGAGKWILGGANIYTGTTTVSAGTLVISSTGTINTSSAVTVGEGGTLIYNSATGLTVGTTLNGNGTSSRAILGGNGSIDVAITLDNLGDTLSPGNSPGIQPFGVNQTWNSLTYVWEVNDFTGTTAGTHFDQIAITGNLSLTGGTGNYSLDITSLTAGNVVGLVPNFSEADTSWTILTTTTGITGFDPSDWSLNSTLFTSSPMWAGSFSLDTSLDGNDLVLNYSAIPEPGTVVLLGLGSAFMLWNLRRRRQG